LLTTGNGTFATRLKRLNSTTSWCVDRHTNLEDQSAIVEALVERNITIVCHFIGSYWLESQLYFIKGLAEAKRRTGEHVHLTVNIVMAFKSLGYVRYTGFATNTVSRKHGCPLNQNRIRDWQPQEMGRLLI
jgi:hypothetical protein